MKSLSIALAVLTLPLTAQSMAGTRVPKQYSIQQFMTNTTFGGGDFSHDGSWILLHSNASGVRNACRLDLKGGAIRPLTTSAQDEFRAVACFPADNRAILASDKGNNELAHLFVREEDGSMKDLTPGPKTRASFKGWAPDAKGFYAVVADRDPKAGDLYHYDIKTYERKLLFKNDGASPYLVSSLSRDGRRVSLRTVASRGYARLFVRDLDSGQMKELLPHPGREVMMDPESFTPDGRGLMVLTNEGSETTYLVKVDLESGESEVVEKPRWDVTACYFSPSGRYRVTETNQDASTVVRVMDLKTGKPLPLPKMPVGEIRELFFNPDETAAALYVNGDRCPTNLWLWDLKAGKASPLTRSLGPDLNPEDLVDSRIVRFRSFDGLEIPSVFYLPKGASSKAKVPALIYVHGGPGGQMRVGYSDLIQHLVNHGYAVLGINHRGSSGYGKSFYAADDQKHGREPLWDCIEAKNFLASLPEIDRERIGIMGGSYGGYMTLAALAYRPEAFKVGVDIFGISNWFRMLESLPPQLEAQRVILYKEIGHPEKDKDRLRAISPYFAADQVRVPLLVLQGARDPRVPKAESDDIVAAVKKNGVPVDYVLFEDEGHGFRKKQNREKGSERVLAFLDRYLKGAGSNPLR